MLSAYCRWDTHFFGVNYFEAIFYLFILRDVATVVYYKLFFTHDFCMNYFKGSLRFIYLLNRADIATVAYC